MPEGSIPLPLTPSGTRALAATMAGGANPTVPPHTVSTVIDALDAVSKTLLVTLVDGRRERRRPVWVVWRSPAPHRNRQDRPPGRPVARRRGDR